MSLDQVEVPVRNWQTGQITGYRYVTAGSPFDPTTGAISMTDAEYIASAKPIPLWPAWLCALTIALLSGLLYWSM